jgi:excisionase family DNA binding protein
MASGSDCVTAPDPSIDEGQSSVRGIGKRLLSLSEVAHLLGVSKPTAERLHAGGKLPAPIRLSRKVVRWDAAELNDWLTRRKRSGDLYDRAEWSAIREAAGRSPGRS